jgi:DNA-binding transcriptional MerR regulator
VGKKPQRRADIVIVPEAAQLTVRSSPPTVTVGGLAEMLAPIAPDQAAVVQQLRHWTRENLLRPIEHSHGGPGKHREYDKSTAVYDAAFLHLVNALDLPVGGSNILVNALTQVRSEVAKRLAGRGRKKPHLIMARTLAGATAVAVIDEGEKIVEQRGFKTVDVVATIDIDLGKLFAQIEPVR